MTGAGDIYGKSMYDLAVSENLEEEILTQLKTVAGIFRDNPDYVALLSEPSIPKAVRINLVDEAFAEGAHEYVRNFIKVLLERGLLRQFGACVKKYESSYNKDNGIAEALVTSAVKLSDEEALKLTERLSKMSGKKVALRQKVDPAVLGGLKVELEGKLMDGTVSGRLSEIGKRVKNTVL